MEKGKQSNGVLRLGNGTYQAVANLGYDSQGKRVRKYVYAKKRKDVLRKKNDLEAQVGLDLDALDLTVEQHLQSWLEDYVKHHNALNTYRIRAHIVNKHLVPRLRSRTGNTILLRDLSPTDVQRALRAMQEDGIGGATVHAAYVALSTALEYAVRFNRVPVNVCKRVPRPKVARKKQYVYSGDEVRQLLLAARENDLYALILLACKTGAREGELFALTWRNVNFQRGTVFFDSTLTEDEAGRLARTSTKTEKSKRAAPIGGDVLAALRGQYERAEDKSPEAYVFTDRLNGPLRKSNFIRRVWRPLTERAGLPPTTFHCLRHSVATYLFEKDIPIEAISRLLGHATVAITDRIYNHAKIVPFASQLTQALDEILADSSADQTVRRGASPKSETPEKLSAIGRFQLVEMRRLELLTPYMRSKCSTS